MKTTRCDESGEERERGRKRSEREERRAVDEMNTNSKRGEKKNPGMGTRERKDTRRQEGTYRKKTIDG